MEGAPLLGVVVLGAGDKPRTGALNVDIRNRPGVDVLWDLDHYPWPFGPCRVLIAEHILEHLNDPERALREMHRVLVPGGVVKIEVPHWKHWIAHASIQHKSTWAHNSFDGPEQGDYGNYAVSDMFKLGHREFRLFDTRWRWISNQVIGQQLCKRTHLVSALQFYLVKRL